MRVVLLFEGTPEQDGEGQEAGLRQVGLHVEPRGAGGRRRRDAPVAPQLVTRPLQAVERLRQHVVHQHDAPGRRQQDALWTERPVGDVAGVVQHGQAAEHLARHLEPGAGVEGQQAEVGRLEDLHQPGAGHVIGEDDRPTPLGAGFEPEDAGKLHVLEFRQPGDAFAQGGLDGRELGCEVEPLHDLARARGAPFAHTETVAKDHAFFRRFREVCYFHRTRPFQVLKAAAITRITVLFLQRPHQTCHFRRTRPSPCLCGGC